MIGQQEPTTKTAPEYGDADGCSIVDLDRWFDEMWQARESMIPWWQAIGRNLLPRKLDFGDGQRSGRTLRAKTTVIDRTATHALRTAVSGLWSGQSPPSRRWWGQSAPNERLARIPAVRDWLDKATDVGHNVTLRAGYYTSLYSLYEDEIGFGTGAVCVYETDDDDMARCEHWPLGSYSLTRDYAGRVNGVGRQIAMTLRQVAEQFGKDAMSESMRRRLAKGPETKVIIRHAIREHRGERTPLGPLSMPFEEIYWEAEPGSKGATGDNVYPKSITNTNDTGKMQRVILKRGGFHEMPTVVFTWGRTGTDVFGTECPGMDALEDILMLQEMARDGLNATKKKVDPPLQIPPGMEQTPVSYLPGGRTSLPPGLAGDARVRNLHEPVDIDLSDLKDYIGDVRRAIENAFFVYAFAPISQFDLTNPPTAAQVYETRREQLGILGPLQENNTRYGHGLVINRIMAIIYRRAELDWIAGREGILPPPPRELAGVEPMTFYRSEVALAQRESSIAAFDRHEASLLATAASVPSVLDTYRWDEAVRLKRELMGLPERVSASEQEIQAVRQARAEDAALQSAAQAAPGVARAAKDLGDTKYDDESILARAS